MVTVLGVDPGLTRCGYALISQHQSSFKAKEIEVIKTSKESPTPDRLLQLQLRIEEILNHYSPDVVAIEKVFIKTNLKSGTAITQAAGIVMAQARKASAQIAEYTPAQIKKAVTNWGGADKKQVQEMVMLLLGLKEIPEPADAADAAAVALCHFAQAPQLIR